jgi:hypothetical protein
MQQLQNNPSRPGGFHQSGLHEPGRFARADRLRPRGDARQLRVKKLPDRILPLSQQMMYAGGFMVFLALMITSLQNFNPND